MDGMITLLRTVVSQGVNTNSGSEKVPSLVPQIPPATPNFPPVSQIPAATPNFPQATPNFPPTSFPQPFNPFMVGNNLPFLLPQGAQTLMHSNPFESDAIRLMCFMQFFNRLI